MSQRHIPALAAAFGNIENLGEERRQRHSVPACSIPREDLHEFGAEGIHVRVVCEHTGQYGVGVLAAWWRGGSGVVAGELVVEHLVQRVVQLLHGRAVDEAAARGLGQGVGAQKGELGVVERTEHEARKEAVHVVHMLLLESIKEYKGDLFNGLRFKDVTLLYTSF